MDHTRDCMGFGIFGSLAFEIRGLGFGSLGSTGFWI